VPEESGEGAHSVAAVPLRTVVVVTVACILAACGTRLPDSAFTTTTVAGTPTSAASTNPASDIGVTATEVRVGLIVSKTSALGSETFSPPMYGALAYFKALNERGGVAGRTVDVDVCDDSGTGAGNRNCVHKLVDDDKVFAFAGNSIYQYVAAAEVSDKDVPDIAGQPVGNAYDQYQHLYNLYGAVYPRNGKVGYDGKLYGGTEVYRYFKTTLGTKTAAVVSYNQADSQRFADLIVRSLEVEGYSVVSEQVDFAVPNFDAVAADMKAHGVDSVFDSLDAAGNVNLCNAMDSAGLAVKAKVTTVQSWDETVPRQYAKAPTCRNSLYATSMDRNYMDTQYPAVAQFRADIQAAYPDRADRLSMWELEGWASAQWLTDAMTACGPNLARACVEAYMNRPLDYDGHGVLIPRNFIVEPTPAPTQHNCLNVAQWQDNAYDRKGGWVTRVPDMNTNCFDVPAVAYSA
jgi:branched-chain amino acid transport system substrate-binding protein